MGSKATIARDRASPASEILLCGAAMAYNKCLFFVLWGCFVPAFLHLGCSGAVSGGEGLRVGPSVPPEVVPTGRLPRTVVPQGYRLELAIDPQRESFEGMARIDVLIQQATDTIWLHGRDLEVARAELVLPSGERLSATYEQVDEVGVARVRLEQELSPQRATLEIAYEAPFNVQLDGLYRVLEDGRWYAFTQFEAIAARRCFPGFDEPSFKTPFEVSLTVPEDLVAIANGPALEEKKLGNGQKRVRFQRSKNLPTYLVALAVGPFDVVESKPIAPNDTRKNPIPLRGIAVKGKGSKLSYALEHTGRLLETLEDYFGIAYPFSKIDIVAVPDFAAGAMENVGLITFREWLLLVDPKVASARQKRAFAYVMAHELAHQWFGNLVTMPWWNDIWLNEAFASWSEFRAIEIFDANMKPRLTQVEEAFAAMNADSLVSSRQIRQPILSNHDIQNAFDAITYSKGAGVLAMFESFLGKERFRRGVRHYLKKHSYGNATAEQFLEALSESSGIDVTEAFNSFLTQAGVPFVRVESSCDKDRATVHLEQSRYFPVGSSGNTNHSWRIPLCMKYGRGNAIQQHCRLVSEPKTSFVLAEEGGCPDWILPNAEGAGYYRWSLSEHDLKALKKAAEAGKLSSPDLLSVADSLDAAFKSAALSASQVLDFAPLFATHSERSVAKFPMRVIEFAHKYVVDGKSKEEVERFGRDVYAKAFARLGLEKEKPQEDDNEQLFRTDLVSFLAWVGRDPQLRRRIVRKAYNYLGYKSDGRLHPEMLDANLAAVALGVAVEEGEPGFIKALIERLKEENDPTLRRQFLQGLSRSKDPTVSAQLRELLIEPSIRSNEVFRFLLEQMAEAETRDPTWNWVQENYDVLVKRLPAFHSGRLPWLTASFCDRERSEPIRAFFRPRIEKLPGGPRNLRISLEAMKLCAARVVAHKEGTHAFFSRNN